MSAHTPGPWTLHFGEQGYPLAIDAPRERWSIPGAVGAIVRSNGIGMPSSSEGLANALLITAAPDLLAACKQAAKLAWEVGSESEDGVLTLLEDSRGDLYRQLRDAIAKAEGT